MSDVPSTLPQTRFHQYHGNNLNLLERDTVAQRGNGFANAIAFGERPLSPGEVFLVEIEGRDNDWMGHLRLGLTRLNPDALQSVDYPLPSVAIPDMTALEKKMMGETWISQLTERHAYCEYNYLEEYYRVDGANVFTSKGVFPTRLLRSSGDDETDDIGAADVGSRVGVMYLPCDQHTAMMYFIINGEIVAPLSRYFALNDFPIRAVIDLYGSTKRVRIIQLYDANSLKSACRHTILKNIQVESIPQLELPDPLKEYLLFKTTGI